MALSESPNLLVTPGRQIASREEMNRAHGPEELMPKEIQAKIDANTALAEARQRASERRQRDDGHRERQERAGLVRDRRED